MDYTGKVITKNPVTPTQASASGVWTLDEALQAQKGNNWPVPGVYNPISRSLRFNSPDNAYLNRTPAVGGNRKTWTWSGWVKRGKLSTLQALETVQDGASEDSFAFLSGDILRVYMSPVGGNGTVTDAVFRDPSAWYHIVIAVDTTQATAANRTIIYVNGVNVTSSSSNYVNQNADTRFNGVLPHFLGRYANQVQPEGNFDGYMTEINFIDGQALTPSDFGLADPATGVWVPKKYTGTYGTNGFYLNFKDNSNLTTIGYDYSGNGNNWNTNNFSVTAGTGNDSLTDVPTLWLGYSSGGDTGGVVRGNYCTLNPLKNTATLSNGNLNSVNAGTSGYYTSYATMSMDSGKYYWEIEVTDDGVNARYAIFGIADPSVALTAITNSAFTGTQAVNSRGWAQAIRSSLSAYSTGLYNNGGTVNSTLRATTTGTRIFMVAYNADTGKCWMGYEGTWWTGDPSAGTSEYFTATAPMIPVVNPYNDGSNSSLIGFVNFGQRPFSYSPPAGYRSLCTTNLPTPAIGTSSTTQANDYFNPVLYNGTGATLGVTGVGFQPDFVWIKSRSAATDHALYDVVRGDKNQLESNTTTAETNETTGLTQFNADGFTVGTLAQVNTNSATYVSWNWKAGGNGVTNTAGSISSTVSANTDAGFSVVTYTGTGSNATVGHGCKVNNVATAPSMLIVKRRSAADAWYVFHTSLPSGYAIQLNNSTPDSSLPTIFNSTAPTSTVFSIGTDSAVNANTATYIAYCFAPVAGYSAFGSYTGNGSADGPFIYTGFRPEWILVKPNSTSGSWLIHDAARDPYNVSNLEVQANANSAEYNTNTAGAGDRFDLLSNGFKNRSSNAGANLSSATYIYAAFAEFPFKFSNAR
jgi:hypothetical protein